MERRGEYKDRGDYHLDLDPNWPYLPVYLAKMRRVRAYLDIVSKTAPILDVGCGEGALVQEYRAKGYEIHGVDPNYESAFVQKGDVTGLDFPAESFQVVLCLDVLEHLNFKQHDLALAEISRVLDDGGNLLLTVPNLAHLASRLSFLISGRLIRTSDIERHPGDRPISEYLDLIQRYLVIQKRIGLFPTFPLLSILTKFRPAWSVPFHRIYNRLFAIPSWCFLNLVIAVK